MFSSMIRTHKEFRKIYILKNLGGFGRCFSTVKEESDKLNEAEERSREGRVWPRRIVSAIQPTGAIHVGNYFGVLRRCVELQEAGEDVTFFIADLHSLTSQQGPGSRLSELTLEAGAAALGAGLDPARVFVQSAVPRHAELCWLLLCLCSEARLGRVPARDGADSAGARAYPVLQAADVLLHRGTLVPVGADQLHHLQLAAGLARTFRHRYADLFPVPRPLLPEDGCDRIKSLRDPLKKMSKSDPDPKSRILLTDSDEVIKFKIQKAVTDCNPEVTWDPESRPGVSGLVQLHCAAARLRPAAAVDGARGLTTAQYKAVVAGAVCGAVRAARARAAGWSAKPRALRAALRAGADRARRHADAVYAEVAQAVGISHDVDTPAWSSSEDRKAECESS